MGKCSVCGNRIEYNAFVIIDGKVYCPACVLKKAKEAEVVTKEDIAVAEAIIEAKEQFEKDMAGEPEENKLKEEDRPKKRTKKKKPNFINGDED